MARAEKVLEELKFWLDQTISYRDGFVKNGKDKVEITTLKEVAEKIKEIENCNKIN